MAGQNVINGQFLSVFNLYNNEREKCQIFDLISNDDTTGKKFFLIDKNEEKIVLKISIEYIMDHAGILNEYIIIMHDITKQSIVDEKSIALLDEKTLLLKEIHHRVKNNLQIIMSIIELQTHNVEDTKIINLLIDLKARIRSISLIHEKLYQSDTSDEVNMNAYIRELVDYLKGAFSLNNTGVIIKMEVDPIKLNHESALNIGLLVTELITNCIKYAFPSNEGEIRIFLKPGLNRTRLIVKDNGCGLPVDLDIKHSNSLGMLLISALTSQLDGEYEFIRDKGTEFHMLF